MPPKGLGSGLGLHIAQLAKGHGKKSLEFNPLFHLLREGGEQASPFEGRCLSEEAAAIVPDRDGGGASLTYDA